jgi:hypothetical protein
MSDIDCFLGKRKCFGFIVDLIYRCFIYFILIELDK